MTEAERRWESWYQAFTTVFEAFPQPIDVPCPEGDGGHVHLTFYGFPGTHVDGSATQRETPSGPTANSRPPSPGSREISRSPARPTNAASLGSARTGTAKRPPR